MELRDFTPAQTLMLTKPLGVTGKDLMKYSFLDLIYRGVLKVYRDWRLPNPRDTRERLYTFVSRGELFKNYQNSYHQDPFIEPFIKDDYEYQVRTLVRKIFKESGKGSGFKSGRVYKQLKEEGYFTTSFGLKNLNFFFLNKHGSTLKTKFKNILKEADEALPMFAISNKEEAKKIISILGSNILLLECFNDELIKKLKPIFGELGQKYEHYSDGPVLDHEDLFEVLFYAFLDTIDYFDSSFNSFDSSFDFGGSDFGGDFGAGDFGGDFGGID